MKIKNSLEVFLGIAILSLTMVFFVKMYNIAAVKKYNKSNIVIIASFNNIDGIDIGSDVKIGGVKIGSVIDVNVNKQYTVDIKMSFDDKNIQIPVDSKAIITSSGLLGGKYVAIEAGVEEMYMKNGDRFELTQSSISLENLIGKFAFNDKK